MDKYRRDVQDLIFLYHKIKDGGPDEMVARYILYRFYKQNPTFVQSIINILEKYPIPVNQEQFYEKADRS